MNTSDHRSNRCARCGHTYTSRWHATHCQRKTISQFRAGNRASYKSRAGQGSSRRAPGWAAGLTLSAGYYRDEADTPEVQSCGE